MQQSICDRGYKRLFCTQLKQLSTAQLDGVLFQFDMPLEFTHCEVAPVQQIQDLIRYAEQKCELEKLRGIIVAGR